MPRQKGTTIRPLEVQQIVTMRDRGTTWGEIERVMGYSKAAMRLAYKRAGGTNWRTYDGVGERKSLNASLSTADHTIYLQLGGIQFLRKALRAAARGEIAL